MGGGGSRIDSTDRDNSDLSDGEEDVLSDNASNDNDNDSWDSNDSPIINRNTTGDITDSRDITSSETADRNTTVDVTGNTNTTSSGTADRNATVDVIGNTNTTSSGTADRNTTVHVISNTNTTSSGTVDRNKRPAAVPDYSVTPKRPRDSRTDTNCFPRLAEPDRHGTAADLRLNITAAVTASSYTQQDTSTSVSNSTNEISSTADSSVPSTPNFNASPLSSSEAGISAPSTSSSSALIPDATSTSEFVEWDSMQQYYPNAFPGQNQFDEEIRRIVNQVCQENMRDKRTFNERHNIPKTPRPLIWTQLPAFTTATEIFFSVQTRGRQITEIGMLRNNVINVIPIISDEIRAQLPRRNLIFGGGDASLVPDRLYSVALRQALEKMRAFLNDSSNNVMVGYKLLSRRPGQSQAVTLLRAMKDHDMLQRFTNLAQGFLDLEVIIKKTVKLQSYTLESLAKLYLKKELKSGSARDEIITMQRIVKEKRQEIDTNLWKEASCTVENALDFSEELRREESNYKTFADMIKHDGCTDYYARKLARSNLQAHHLEAVYRGDGVDGVKILLERLGKEAKDTTTRTVRLIAKYFDDKQQQPPPIL